MDHPWFKKFPPKTMQESEVDRIHLDNEIVGSLLKYRGMSKVRMTALRILVAMMDKKDVEPLRRLFLDMDHDRTGFITTAELQEAMEKSNFKFTKDQIKEIVSEVDLHQNGKINYTEFIAATLCVEKYMTDQKLREVFMHFDVDDTEYISKENIRESMGKMGQELTPEEIEQALGIHDVKGDHRISFEEFKHMFLPNEKWMAENDEIVSPYRIVKQTTNPVNGNGEFKLQKRGFDADDDSEDHTSKDEDHLVTSFKKELKLIGNESVIDQLSPDVRKSLVEEEMTPVTEYQNQTLDN